MKVYNHLTNVYNHSFFLFWVISLRLKSTIIVWEIRSFLQCSSFYRNLLPNYQLWELTHYQSIYHSYNICFFPQWTQMAMVFPIILMMTMTEMESQIPKKVVWLDVPSCSGIENMSKVLNASFILLSSKMAMVIPDHSFFDFCNSWLWWRWCSWSSWRWRRRWWDTRCAGR